MPSAGTAPVAVVTGSNRGIGLEVCRQLAGRNYQVVLGSREVGKGQQAAASLAVGRDEGGEKPDVVVCQLDVADPDSVQAAASWVGERFGRCDALVNNAAILYDTWAYAASADLDSVHQALETNLLGAWRTTLALLPLLRASDRGRVVNVSSEGGSLASMGAGAPAYHVSKAALNALTRTLAAELRPAGILVNAICPGWTATDMGGRGGRPVAEGAASVVWAVTLPDDGPTGGFFRDGQPLSW